MICPLTYAVSIELQERTYEHDCLHALSFVCEVAVAFNVNTQYSRTNKMHFLYSVYYELTAPTCFEHYLLIFRRCCINNTWYIACVMSVGSYQIPFIVLESTLKCFSLHDVTISVAGSVCISFMSVSIWICLSCTLKLFQNNLIQN
jgi:hypothetical protein